jgi:hypothetical protein
MRNFRTACDVSLYEMTLDSPRWRLIVVAVLAFGVLSACEGDTIPSVTSTSMAATSTTIGSVTTTTTTPAFDVDQFLTSKLGGVFESEDTVGVVLLVPPPVESEAESLLVSLAELEGYSHVSPEVVASAADGFAEGEGTSRLVGEWVGYGLIPRFYDSPVDEWVSTLSGLPGAHVSQVDFAARTVRIPDGWSDVTDLPFQLESGAIVEGLPSGLVVLQSDSTMLIDPSGSVLTGEPAPVPIQAECCGPADGLPAGRLLVLVAESSTESWILDTDSLTWRQAAARPDPGYVLGSTVIGGELFVVTAAPRTGEATSPVAVLDLESGAWRRVDEVPEPISVGGVTSDGNTLIVAGTRQDGNNVVVGDGNPVAYQYTPSEGWGELTAVPIDGQSSTVAWAEGAGLLAWNYDLESALLDGSGTWRQLGEVPMPSSECSPEARPTASGLVGFCGGIAIFDTETEQWIPVFSPLDARYGVVGDSLLGLVRLDREHTKLVTYPTQAEG